MCIVDPEDGCVAWCVDIRFYPASLDCVLDSVKGEFCAEELEELVGCFAGDVGLEVQ